METMHWMKTDIIVLQYADSYISIQLTASVLLYVE